MKKKTEIKLSSKEITQVRGQVKKLRNLRNQMDFNFQTPKIEVLFKDKVKIIIDEKKDHLKCTRCPLSACDGATDTEYLFVCKDLPKELQGSEQIRRTHSKKVDNFTYREQPNKSGNIYWYLQFTENGRTKNLYLGSETPTFNPKTDIARANMKKSQKKLNKETLTALIS